MKLKQLFSCLIVFFIAGGLFGQQSGDFGNTEEFNVFLKSKLLIILNKNEEYNTKVKEVFAEYWKITPFEFIKAEDVKNYGDPKYSFFRISEFTRTDFIGSANQETVSFSCFRITLGCKDKPFCNEIALGMVDVFGQESDIYNSLYRLPTIVRSMQYSIQLRKDGKVRGSYKIEDDLNANYNKNSGLITKKTLVINKKYTGDRINEEKLKELYPYKFKLVDDAEYEKLLKETSSEYCFLVPIFSSHKNIYVFDNETGGMIYDEFSKYGTNLNEGDLKKLAKAIAK